MSLEAGTRVGRYTITRLLAQGGMAEVYRAEQDLAQGITRPVAVKVIRPEYSESQDFRDMFLDEARTACTLSHPNIAHIYEVGESDAGQLYMAMELVAGETLATINRTLREHGERFSDEALFAIGVATCGALEAVHALKTEGGTVNLVHRDVSPHNLLLSSSGALKLIDFGIAKAVTNRNLTMPGVTKGKAGYFSPEQAMGKKLDGRSDLFSLGVTLYKLASGETPFDDFKTHGDRHAALVRGQWKRLEDVYRGLPTGFYEVVGTALALAPDHRFQSARDMREALERAAFDARLRLGQSSLFGYVDDDGEITATGGARTSSSQASLRRPAADTLSDPESTVDERRPSAEPTPARKRATLALPMPPPAQTDRLLRAAEPERAPTFRRPLMALAFVASLIIGVFGSLLLLSGSEPQRAVGVDAAGSAPIVVKKPTLPHIEVPEVNVEPDPPRVVVAPTATPSVTNRPKNVRPPPKVEVKEPPKEPEAVVIPPGQGTLRIDVRGAGRSTIIVGTDDWGAPPVNRKINSGNFKVMVKLDDGSSPSVRAVVMPDQTTIITYDAASQKWAIRP